MSFFAWMIRQWREGDEILRSGSRFTAQTVEHIRRLRHGERLLRGPMIPLTRYPTATGPPRRRSRRRVVMIEEITEEDDPDYTP